MDFTRPAVFDRLRLERVALTLLVMKPGLVPLVTSSVQSVRLRIHFTPRSSLVSFNDLTDLYMKALVFKRWLSQALPLSVMMRVLLLGLSSVRLFITCHISLVPFTSSTLRCQIPHFTSVVSRDTSLLRFLYASMWMPSL